MMIYDILNTMIGNNFLKICICLNLFLTGMMKKITQMPIVLIPVHFDIDPLLRDPFCQRSVVLRPFLTNDFMTGVAAQPGKDVPIEV